MTGQQRVNWADYAKGLTIILVVYGHAVVGVAKDVPIDPTVFAYAMKPFSQFRMPVFFFVAGLFAAFSIKRATCSSKSSPWPKRSSGASSTPRSSASSRAEAALAPTLGAHTLGAHTLGAHTLGAHTAADTLGADVLGADRARAWRRHVSAPSRRHSGAVRVKGPAGGAVARRG